MSAPDAPPLCAARARFRHIDLDPARALGSVSIVGIDLTGSQARPSGWCDLRGDHACVQRLASDAALVAATLAARPALVSIDAPLSLPRGRLRAADDDPGRAQFGITRACERALRARGIGVYPCLIPSMQKLTERGMRLAACFRAQGVPVIEGYPGGAQDILGIPRKRAGRDRLRSGLVEFGLRGAWECGRVSHDELDAITAALVGQFFQLGRFTALGDADEGLLIVPLEPAEARGRGTGVAIPRRRRARDLEPRGV